MMEEIKIKKKNILVPLIAAILIVIVDNLKVDSYFKDMLFPFLTLIVSNIILLYKNKDINKKAYYMLIPIFLVLFSDVILRLVGSNIDESNLELNVIILPILITMFLFLLTNKNYKISLKNIPLMFKLFPKGMFKNLKLIKPNITKEKNKKIANILIGSIVGFLIASIILILLQEADDYFSFFIQKLTTFIKIDYDTLISILFYFILIFNISINLIKNKNLKMKETKYKIIDNTIIVTVLSIINFVFVLFLISEISKLCGNFLQIPKGYIYSSYAREGFFQLLFVTIINFLIIAYLMYKTKSIKESKMVKYMVFLLVLFSILLVFNSYYRMFMYIRVYTFTILRLQVILFLLMELILFGIIIKNLFSKIKNSGLVYFVVIVIIYIINLYLCNDWFVDIISKLVK